MKKKDLYVTEIRGIKVNGLHILMKFRGSETKEVTKCLSYATTLVNTYIMYVRNKFYWYVQVN